MRAFARVRRLVGIGALSVGTAAAMFTVGAAPASAVGSDRYVATDGEDFVNQVSNLCKDQGSPCLTLGHAVSEADPGDTVHMAAGTYNQHVVIAKNLTIVGAGIDATKLTDTTSELSGKPCERASQPTIRIDGANAAVSVTVQGVSVDGNQKSSGIEVCDGDLHLTDSSASKNHVFGVVVVSILRAASATITGSQAHDNGQAGIAGEFAALPQGLTAVDVTQAATLTVSHTVVSDNAGAGVAVSDAATVAVDHSTITHNLAGVLSSGTSTATVATSTLDSNLFAGAAAIGGALDIGTSTVSNSKPSSIGGGEALGAGVVVIRGIGHVTNSTVAGNTGQGVLAAEADVTVSQSTVSGTKSKPVDAIAEGGIVNAVIPTRAVSAGLGVKRSTVTAAAALTPAVTVSGSITANQAKGVHDCAGNMTDGGYNLSSDDSCKFTAAKHDLPSTDPLLGALADNGGPTQTEKPKKGSPAIDAVDADKAGCSTGATDQRGVARPQPTGGKCDIGAVELAAKAIVISPDTLPHGTVGKSYTQQLAATGGQYPSYTFSLVTVPNLPPGLTMDSTGKISGTPTKAGTFTFTVSVNDPVLKDYTIVIDAAAISNTGSHTGSMLAVGSGAILAGFLIMLGAGFVGRRPSGPRIVRRDLS